LQRVVANVRMQQVSCRYHESRLSRLRRSVEPILLIDLVSHFARSHKFVMVEYLPILPIRRTHFAHTRNKSRASR
jgi:hypothetical protein